MDLVNGDDVGNCKKGLRTSAINYLLQLTTFKNKIKRYQSTRHKMIGTLINLRAIGTSVHHMSTDVARTSKNVATKNQCYLDVIFMTSDRCVLTDVVRTLVSGRRRRDLHKTNTRRRMPTGELSYAQNKNRGGNVGFLGIDTCPNLNDIM